MSNIRKLFLDLSGNGSAALVEHFLYPVEIAHSGGNRQFLNRCSPDAKGESPYTNEHGGHKYWSWEAYTNSFACPFEWTEKFVEKTFIRFPNDLQTLKKI